MSVRPDLQEPGMLALGLSLPISKYFSQKSLLYSYSSKTMHATIQSMYKEQLVCLKLLGLQDDRSVPTKRGNS